MSVEDVRLEDWYRSKGKSHLIVEDDAPKKQVVVYKWGGHEIRVEIDPANCCEYSESVRRMDILRVCRLEEFKEYRGGSKSMLMNPVCPARLYASLYMECPIRSKQLGKEV